MTGVKLAHLGFYSFSSQRLSKTVLILTFQEINPIDFYAATHTEQFFFSIDIFSTFLISILWIFWTR